MQNFKGLMDYCLETGVHGIINFGIGVTMRSGNREYFYEQLDKHFPGLSSKYKKSFGGCYELLSPNNHQIMQYFYKTCKENKILCTPDECFSYMHDFPQSRLQNEPKPQELFDY